jgi:hypothetical protein
MAVHGTHLQGLDKGGRILKPLLQPSQAMAALQTFSVFNYVTDSSSFKQCLSEGDFSM